MKNIKMVVTNKWFIMIVLIITAYCYAAIYESASTTPIDELGQIMTNVTNEEDFVESYTENDWGMSLDQYKESLNNISLLKSRFLQGPLCFLTSLIVFLIAVLLNHTAVRIHEKIVRFPQKTPIIDTIDACFPVLLAEAIKYIICALYASFSGSLIDYNVVLSTILAVICSMIPYILNFFIRRNAGKPAAAVIIACVLATTANLAFHLI